MDGVLKGAWLLLSLRLPLQNIPAPSPELLNDFGRDRRRHRDTDKDEALVNRISESELCP
jgi:hypothetical protein